MQDYLLVQGPPGTGKTSVIAEIVKRLCQQGQRVMLAAFTNQAVDNMLRRLDAEGFHDYLRLGHERNFHTDIHGRLLKKLVEPAAQPRRDVQETERPSSLGPDLLYHPPLLGSTTATWSS